MTASTSSSTLPTPLSPARAPQPGFQPERLLVIDPLTRRVGDYRISELPRLLGPGDALIVNDAATVPASLRVDAGLELRLVAAEQDGSFRGVTFGSGDFRQPTETRGQPRGLRVGETLSFGPQLQATVTEVDAGEARLLRVRFSSSGAALWRALYLYGTPIQYAYAQQPLALWDVQNRYAARPWAFELPSAGRPLTFELLFELEKRGAALSSITHAASISSTGSSELDQRLPLAERYEIGEQAAAVIAQTRGLGGRVIAAGTSVVRALEAAAAADGGVTAGSAETELRLSGSHSLRVVDGLLTGLHEPGTSHFALLEAFAPRRLLERAIEHAARTGYLQHEFGDSCLVLAGALLERLEA